MRGEKFGANLPLFWNNDGKDRPKGQIYPLAKKEVFVCIRGPLVDILVSIAPDVYGPYVSTNKSGQKVLIVKCLNAVYGSMVAALLYYKKFVKSLTKKGLNSTHMMGA